MSVKPNFDLPRLYVEGENDCRVICALINALGIELDKDLGPVFVEPKGYCSELLQNFELLVKPALSMRRSVGFVLDIDRPEDNRKAQLRDRFAKLGVTLVGADFAESGIIKEVEGIKVGVWLMPYPASPSGKLEDFLRALIPAEDRVLPKAQAYVADVQSSVAQEIRFRDIDREKAELASWLAVQRNPGESPAMAITARQLHADSPLASAFVGWFRRLYDLDATSDDTKV